MKSEKHILVLIMGIAMVFILVGFSCQRSPLAPDDDLVQHLQALSDSSNLKKQSVKDSIEITTERLDELRGHPLESNSNKSVELSSAVGYGLLALIIIGFALGFYFW